MGIKENLKASIHDLQNLLDKTKQLFPNTGVGEAKRSLDYAIEALACDEEGMYWAWVEATLARAALAAQLHALCSQTQNYQLAVHYRDMALNIIAVLMANLPILRAVPFMIDGLAQLEPLIAAIQAGNPIAMGSIAGLLYSLHDRVLAAHDAGVVPADAGSAFMVRPPR